MKLSDRPARVQVSKDEYDSMIQERAVETQHKLGPAAVYNTWYRKWAGADQSQGQARSPFRCSVEKDSGYTKSKGPVFCLWFARGACYKGENCTHLHRIPELNDAVKLNATVDCFGRSKFAQYRDDMGGVGSFLTENRTLFVGHFNEQADRKGSQRLTNQLRASFSEWGPVESVRLGKHNKIAFVSFKWAISSEFAKEAMANQTLTGRETLTVRWARESGRDKTSTDSAQDANLRSIVRRVLSEKATKKRLTLNGYDAEDDVTAHDISAADETTNNDALQYTNDPAMGDARLHDEVSDKSEETGTPAVLSPSAEAELKPKRRRLVNYD